MTTEGTADGTSGHDAATQADAPHSAPTADYAAYLSPVAKEKGDLGIYAALDAMQLSRALRGVTDSRLDQSLLPPQQQQQQHSLQGTTTAAGSGVAGARANGAGSGPGHHKTVQLGVEPEEFRHGATAAIQAMLSEAVVEAVQAAPGDGEAMSTAAVRAAVARGMAGNSSSSSSSGQCSTAVGIPKDDGGALERVLPLVKELKPRGPLGYDALQRMFALMESAAAGGLSSAEGDGSGAGAAITSLLLSGGVVDPAKQPAPSTAAWEAKYKELQARYPLPTAAPAGDGADDGHDEEGEEEVEEEDDDDAEGEGSVDRQHSAALQERCAALQLPYTTYKKALRDVAAYEMRVFPLLCAYLSHNDSCRDRSGGNGVRSSAAHSVVRHAACANVKVLNLAGSRLGAPSVPAEQEDGEAAAAPVRQLAPLRALAAMLDANETLRCVNLRDNALGPRGVGIVAKALTKNIALTAVDLSANALGTRAAAAAEDGNTGDVEDLEDPLFEEDDAAFGEVLEGLEALAEVFKKNKFLRVLHLSDNGLHAGEDLTAPPPAEDEEGDGELDTAATEKPTAVMTAAAAQERWTGVPLWTLLSPLCRFHRLRVLDLSKNYLGNAGTQMVAVALAHNQSLEVLDLTDNAIGYTGLSYLARYALSDGAAPLHTLILRQNPLMAAGGAADAATGVDVRGRRLTKRQQRNAATAMDLFAQALQRHTSLRRLVVSSASLGPRATAALLQAAACVSTLEELDVSFNAACGDHPATYDGAAVPHIAALLFPSQPSVLSRLRLDGNNLTPAGLAAALQPPESGAAFSRALAELTLSRNSLGDALGPLAVALASGLARLDLSYNEITTAAALLEGGLPHAAALTELNLSHNKLGTQEGLLRELTAEQQEAEVAALFEAIGRLPQLAVLDLSYNDWRPAHVKQLAATLADSERAGLLRKLDVRHTPHVTAGPLMALLQGVACRPTMEVFLASVVVDNTGEEERLQPAEEERNEEEEAEEDVRWSFSAVVQAVYAVVAESASLVDVDCGLRLCDLAADRSSAEAQRTADQIEQIQERLLLNALVAAARDEGVAA